ncbi:ABC transporter substrate-binding protein, partial [Pseudomonas syringae group sp. J309-1]|uniref:substrate-binding domain-containing protein n=1 Tax=Pseudomonas syringae group sp. J309-1 TaxID=3079588 RepID=UPI00290C6F1C
MPRNRSIQLSRRQLIKGTAAASATLLLGKPAIAKGKTEIVIGNIDAYSGPAAVYSSIGRTPGGYFKMINDRGGINGRKVNFVSYDDAYSPPKAVEQVRKLVESDEVLFLFGTLGTASNTAIQKYMNAKMVPQ